MELKRDRDHIVLTADKGVTMVIIDRQDYINKSNNLLNQPTYRTIPQDPTNTIKNKLISIPKRVKNQTGLDNITYKAMYPKGCVSPNFWAPQNPQTGYTTKASCVQFWISHLWHDQGTCQKFSNPWLTNPYTISTVTMTLWNRSCR